MEDFKIDQKTGMLILGAIAVIMYLSWARDKKTAGALSSARKSDSALLHSNAGYGAPATVESAATQTTLTKPAAIQSAGSQTLAG